MIYSLIKNFKKRDDEIIEQSHKRAYDELQKRFLYKKGVTQSVVSFLDNKGQRQVVLIFNKRGKAMYDELIDHCANPENYLHPISDICVHDVINISNRFSFEDVKKVLIIIDDYIAKEESYDKYLHTLPENMFKLVKFILEKINEYAMNIASDIVLDREPDAVELDLDEEDNDLF